MIYGYKAAKAALDKREASLDKANVGVGLMLFVIGIYVGTAVLALLKG